MSTPESAAAGVAAAQAVMDLEKQFLLQNYARYPLVLHRGKGCWLYSLEGKRYLDLISGIGVNALGHAHPRITKIVREQAGLLLHTSNLYYHEYQGPLAKVLCEKSGMQRVFFCNSGTEAVEGAIKVVHSHGRKRAMDKTQIIALEGSFHGRTVGALSLTGSPKYRQDFEPLMPGVKFVPCEDEAALEAACGPRTAGIIVEPIQGEGGIRPVSAGWLRKARELADRWDALLVFDEIQAGIGRPGAHFAFQLHDPLVLPDVVLLAKPISCGLPLGAILSNERAAAAIAPGMHGSTFGGNALACRVALEFFSILEELLPQMRRVSEFFFDGLHKLKKKHSFVKEVRGAGLMLGMELDFDCKRLVKEAMDEGLLLNVTHDTVIRMLPPYIITEKEAARALRGLGQVLKRENGRHA
jgi:predicted acetylornithine/succinylornithine family transaminase